MERKSVRESTTRGLIDVRFPEQHLVPTLRIQIREFARAQALDTRSLHVATVRRSLLRNRALPVFAPKGPHRSLLEACRRLYPFAREKHRGRPSAAVVSDNDARRK